MGVGLKHNYAVTKNIAFNVVSLVPDSFYAGRIPAPAFHRIIQVSCHGRNKKVLTPGVHGKVGGKEVRMGKIPVSGIVVRFKRRGKWHPPFMTRQGRRRPVLVVLPAIGGTVQHVLGSQPNQGLPVLSVPGVHLYRCPWLDCQTVVFLDGET